LDKIGTNKNDLEAIFLMAEYQSNHGMTEKAIENLF